MKKLNNVKTHIREINTVSFALFILVLLAASALAGEYTADYRGGGIWEQNGSNFWSTTAYPDHYHYFYDMNTGRFYPPASPQDYQPDYHVTINNPAPCALATSVAVISVDVSSGSTLNLANNGKISLSVAPNPNASHPNPASTLINSGVITLKSTGGGSQLRITNGSVVKAGGQILMSDNATNAISAIKDGDLLTINAGGIISGAGQLNLGFTNGEHLLDFVNNGLIEATQPGNPLTIGLQNVNSSNGNLTNSGTLRASSATLRFRTFGGSGTVSQLIGNPAGTVAAIGNGRVRVAPGITVQGGVLVTGGSGSIGGDGPGGGGGVLKDLINGGLVAIADQEELTLSAAFTNNGTVAVNSTGNGATLRFTNGTTLGGTGAVTLSNNASNYLTGVNGTAALTIASAATVQGAGSINPASGGSNLLQITNRGLMEANIPAASLVIRVDTSSGADFTNDTGTLRASNGGNLIFTGTGSLTNNGGTIQALPNSVVIGGPGISFTQTAISGTIDLAGGDMNFPAGVVLYGGQLIGSGVFTGTITNSGGTVGAGHSPGKLKINGDYTQGANGTLNVEIGGATAGTGYDQLVVSGTATLGGTLNITAINGFTPAVGDIYTLLSAGSLAGSFSTVHISDFTGKIDTSSNGVTLTITAAPRQLLNISTRMQVLKGENVLIGGFIVTGAEPKKVLIRGLGPELPVTGQLADPMLQLNHRQTVLATNDNWRDTQEQEIKDTTIPPTNDLEPAIVKTLQPGSYTAMLRGKDGGIGVGQVEVYDLGQAAASQLANISTRGFVDTNNNVMIGGVIIGGGSIGTTAKILVRAIGPSLSSQGVTGALQDPTLELRDANAQLVAQNNDWRTDQEQEIKDTTIPPTDDRESAIVQTLGSGNYTAVVRGAGDTTGVALVEVFALN